MARKRVYLRISGLVQGVFFRATARDEARRMGLCGWVRNLPDGSVESMAEGEAPAVGKYVAWCEHGPPGAQVQSVEISERAAEGDLPDFHVAY
jgi:acylphosphatase